MTNAPYLLPNAHAGYRLGNDVVVDAMIHEDSGARSRWNTWARGPSVTPTSTRSAAQTGRHRLHQSRTRHRRNQAGRFATEIAPVEIPQRKGDPLVVEPTKACAPKPPSIVGPVRPACRRRHHHRRERVATPDGAAALVVMSHAKADELGVEAQAEVVGYSMVAGPDPSLLHQPSRAIDGHSNVRACR